MLQPKPLFFSLLFAALLTNTAAQSVSQKLAAAFRRFETDAQLQAGIASLYVVDERGTVVFQRAATIGLAPASTQKTITSATAYDLLGKDFRYKTNFGFITNANGTTSLCIRGSGDPTLGSGRWPGTAAEAVLRRIKAAAPETTWSDSVFILSRGWNGETIPGGWIWDDIGNYYGAGAGMLNWRENQYDVVLQSGTVVGSPVQLVRTEPALEAFSLNSKAVAAAAGTGDNAYIYFPRTGTAGVVRGTIPVAEKSFVISGALPQPERQLAAELLRVLSATGSSTPDIITTDSLRTSMQIFHTEVSPPLDSIVYWFNKKSINLYGEALLKTIAFQQEGHADADAGMGFLKSYWKGNGIAEAALNLVDGSGLSPLNRMTTQAQVAVLRHAKKQPWFNGFYNSLPEYNGMKMKSGTIRGVKGFAGYHTSRAGVQYTFSFLVNNYNGSASALVKKMYAVLDVLK